MADIDKRLLSSWDHYRNRPMSEAEQRAAAMLTPVPAVLGLTEWRTTDGAVYAKGANAIEVQAGINARTNGVGGSATDRARATCKHLSECTDQLACFGPEPGCRRALGVKGPEHG